MNAPKWPPTKQYVPHLLTHLYEYSESWTCERGILIPFQCRGNVRLCIAMSCKIRLQYTLFDAHIWTVTDSGLKVKALSGIICKCFIVYHVFFSAMWLNCRQVWMFCKHLSCRDEISNISAFAVVSLWFLLIYVVAPFFTSALLTGDVDFSKLYFGVASAKWISLIAITFASYFPLQWATDSPSATPTSLCTT